MNFISYFIDPFLDYGFMRRALIACVALSISGAPLGVFLVLRRMSLIGDSIAHAILPGAAIAFLFFGLSLWPITIGGLIASLIVAIAAGLVTRVTYLKEDASFTGAYLISLAFGVLIISLKGSNIDLMHVLFGNILAVNSEALFLIAAVATASTLVLSLIYRNLIVECFDPLFVRSIKGKGALTHQIFLVLIVLNLVCAFQALGTLMALGIIILPAIAAGFWTRNIDKKIILSVIFAIISSYFGLLFSYHYNLSSGPMIVLSIGFLNIFSIFFGSCHSLKINFLKQ